MHKLFIAIRAKLHPSLKDVTPMEETIEQYSSTDYNTIHVNGFLRHCLHSSRFPCLRRQYTLSVLNDDDTEAPGPGSHGDHSKILNRSPKRFRRVSQRSVIAFTLVGFS